ncbi:hypothetical protein ADL12_18590 [Streptomyces regalis]|uniref:Uncharacterized protein n=1 Tax=Streptomyces regalis TaxID=68262 RepID=A0A0X3UWZ3_9ACTN|nr:hypothetical protein ADL12_18590 [Streptomyces regalis]
MSDPDVVGASSSAGAKVIQWPCTGAARHTVAPVRSGLLLTIASTSDRSLVVHGREPTIAYADEVMDALAA